MSLEQLKLYSGHILCTDGYTLSRSIKKTTLKMGVVRSCGPFYRLVFSVVVRPSVCPPVYHKPAPYNNGLTYRITQTTP